MSLSAAIFATCVALCLAVANKKVLDVDVDQKNEDRQITYAFFDIGTVTVMPRLEPSRDACGDDCYFKHTFTPIGDHKYLYSPHEFVSRYGDGAQTFNLDEGVTYELEVCRSDENGVPVTDNVRYVTGPKSFFDNIRDRCETRVCSTRFSRPENTMFWCGYMHAYEF